MKRKRDILFLIYLLVIIVLAVIYFTVPERRMFLEDQIERYREFFRLVRSLV
jgi:hypothetical protein